MKLRIFWAGSLYSLATLMARVGSTTFFVKSSSAIWTCALFSLSQHSWRVKNTVPCKVVGINLAKCIDHLLGFLFCEFYGVAHPLVPWQWELPKGLWQKQCSVDALRCTECWYPFLLLVSDGVRNISALGQPPAIQLVNLIAAFAKGSPHFNDVASWAIMPSIAVTTARSARDRILLLRLFS